MKFIFNNVTAEVMAEINRCFDLEEIRIDALQLYSKDDSDYPYRYHEYTKEFTVTVTPNIYKKVHFEMNEHVLMLRVETQPFGSIIHDINIVPNVKTMLINNNHFTSVEII